MAEAASQAKRILLIKVRTPSADATTLLTTMMKNTLPLYKTFGNAEIRLLRNADDQAQFRRREGRHLVFNTLEQFLGVRRVDGDVGVEVDLLVA